MSVWKNRIKTQAKTVGGMTPDTFKEKCKEIISEKQRYISKNEISRITGIPRTTICSAGIDTDSYCEELGYPRQTLKPKGSSKTRETAILQLKERYTQFLKEKGQSVSFYKFLKTFCETDSLVSKYYRYNISVEECHVVAGVKYVENYGQDVDHIETTLRNMICEKQRYVTTMELAEQVGVSFSLINLYRDKVDVAKINSEYGFAPNLRGFEFRIAEFLQEAFPEEEITLQKTFPGLVGLNPNRPVKLRYDLCIDTLKLLVEVDGPSHWDENYIYYNKSVLERDALKTKFAAENGYTLLRIKYTSNYNHLDFQRDISGIPLKQSVGQPAAKLEEIQEGSETIRKE